MASANLNSPAAPAIPPATAAVPTITTTVQTVSGLPLVAINPSTQLPIQLRPTNFVSYRAQLESLLIGYDLLGYIEGTIEVPPKLLAGVSNPLYTQWFRQDKLLLYAVFGSVNEKVMPLISSATTVEGFFGDLELMGANGSFTEITVWEGGNMPVNASRILEISCFCTNKVRLETTGRIDQLSSDAQVSLLQYLGYKIYQAVINAMWGRESRCPGKGVLV